MRYLHNKQIIAKLGAGLQRNMNTVSTISMQETAFSGTLCGLIGPYVLTAYDKEPEPETIPLTEPGRSILFDEALRQSHERLARRARVYGNAEDDEQRAQIYGLSYTDLCGTGETVDETADHTSSVLGLEWSRPIANIPSGLKEREVIVRTGEPSPVACVL